MLPPRIQEAINMVTRWVKQHTDDWGIVKQEIMNELNNEHRALFGKQDPKTKELSKFNELETEIIELWKTLTGVTLVIRTPAERRELVWWDPTEAEKNKKRLGRRPSTRKNIKW